MRSGGGNCCGPESRPSCRMAVPSSSARFAVSRSDDEVASLQQPQDGEKSYGATDQTSAQPDTSTHPDIEGESHQSEEQPIIKDKDLSAYEKNLYLYHDELPERPRVATFLSSVANYDVAIPSASESEGKPAPKKANLGTISGVYLPCIQNIFGVIFFIRLVWIVGVAGTIVAFVIVFLCCAVTFTTCISLSAIATNGIVPAGGSYFMISRSLGPEFGGAVGILFYLATTFAGAMYIVGAVEIFLNYIAPQASLFGDIRDDPEIMYNNFRVFGSVLLIIIGIMVFIGVAFVSKLAPIALLCVILSIICVYIGVFMNYNGKEGLEVCILGDRILSRSNPDMDCSKNESNPNSLFYIYCWPRDPSMLLGNMTLADLNKTYDVLCDEYYDNHEPQMTLAVPGLASNVLVDNINVYFREKGEVIALTYDDNVHVTHEKTYNQILVDITTSFTLLVGIFFPSCTGIMAGSNRSGDLADAQKSIPRGTLAAQLTTSFVYLSGVIFFGASFNNLFIRDKFGESIGGGLAVAELAWPHPMVIVVGSLLSTTGAGIQSLTGAPRLLQAIAKDGIIPFLNPFAVSSSRNEPVRALLLTLFICWVGILIGNLDHIAPILTMFFLMCYMFVNLACVLQSVLKTPNWRPRFKCYHWSFSLLGVLLCLMTMFISSWYYALISMAIAGIIYKYIEFSGAEKEWGDGLRGLALSAARYSLLRLEQGPPHTKNYRPQLLVLCKLNDQLVPKHKRLISFAAQLKAGKGLCLISSVLQGDYIKMSSEAATAKKNLDKILEDEKIKGFAEVVVSNNVTDGISHLIQSSGLGGLKHNTVVLTWPSSWRTNSNSAQTFIHSVRTVSSAKHCLLVIKGIGHFPARTEKLGRGTIDVWWIVHDGGLLMLLPYLLKQHRTWKNSRIRIFTVAQMEDNSIQMKKELANHLYQLRIEADVEVVEMTDSDISAYTYERTLMMEQRAEMLKKLTKRRNTLTYMQNLMETRQMPGQGAAPKVRFNEGPPEEGGELEIVTTDGGSKQSSPEKHSGDANNPNTTSGEGNNKPSAPSSDKVQDGKLLTPDDANVRRMHTAVKMNEVIRSKSQDANLVIVNLPGIPKMKSSAENYLEFLEVMTEGLERVLMARGSGREVITIYS